MALDTHPHASCSLRMHDVIMPGRSDPLIEGAGMAALSGIVAVDDKMTTLTAQPTCRRSLGNSHIHRVQHIPGAVLSPVANSTEVSHVTKGMSSSNLLSS